MLFDADRCFNVPLSNVLIVWGGCSLYFVALYINILCLKINLLSNL